jgi:hypothetical protein
VGDYFARLAVDHPLVVVPADILTRHCLTAKVLEQFGRTWAIDVDLVEHRIPIRRWRRHAHVIVRARAVGRPRLLMPELVAREQEKMEVRWSVLCEQLRVARLVGRAVTSVGCGIADENRFRPVPFELDEVVVHECARVVDGIEAFVSVWIVILQRESGAGSQWPAITGAELAAVPRG